MRAIISMTLIGLSTAVLGHQAPLTSSTVNPDAPPQVKQYGQLQGTWSCLGSSLQQDGTWTEASAPATWSWYYVLDGYAVQDVWQPPQGAMGTNLRTYDAEQDKWYMVWATTTQARFDQFEATFEDGQIVMTGDRWARAAFPAHKSRITFHNIGARHFDWKAEISGPNDGVNWTDQAKLSCDRLG